MPGSNSPIILFQYGDNPLGHEYQDENRKTAFSLEEFKQKEDPNRVICLVRDPEWVNQHPTVLGPDKAFFYMGPGDAMQMGYLMYGGGTRKFQMLSDMLRPGKKEESRYWRSQKNTFYKWKVSSHRMECLHKRQSLAVWEVTKPDEEQYYAKLTISPAAMPLVTELMTTLVLNQMALGLTWPIVT